MTEAEFQRLAAQGFNRVPLVAETFADLETPLSLYLKLANRTHTYLLESVVGGERFGRYSFIGLAAPVRLRAVGRLVTVTHGDAITEKSQAADPLDFVREFLARYRVAELPGLPRFCGGLVGYFGYDAVRWIEPRLSGGWLKPDPVGCPDMLLLVSEELAVIDNLSGKLYLVVYADPAKPRAWQDAQARLRELLGALRLPLSPPSETCDVETEVASNFDADTFRAAVGRAIRYVHDGDIMQVVLSQRMSRPFAGSSLSLYRALRSINPSPYMFYFDFGDFQVVSASPEILVRLERGTVTVRPIAGTRRRGATKVRAMEIIDELEPDKRGVYGGAAGYLGFNGDMDLAIAIRTAVVKDGQMHVQAGAGIVADSVPESELQETRAKARAVLRAAEVALSGMSG